MKNKEEKRNNERINRRVFNKRGKKYLAINGRAIPFDDYDENGRPVIKPWIVRDKDENGKDRVRVKVPSLSIKIKSSNNEQRNI